LAAFIGRKQVAFQFTSNTVDSTVTAGIGRPLLSAIPGIRRRSAHDLGVRIMAIFVSGQHIYLGAAPKGIEVKTSNTI
jgi:hypothetical protein